MAAGQIVIEILAKSGAFISDTARAEKSLDSFRKSVGNAGDAFKYLQGAAETANAKIAASETATAEKRVAAARRVLELQGAGTEVTQAEIKALHEAGALTDAQFRKAGAAIDIQNGLTKTYREQLRVLEQLRDAGQITSPEFLAAKTTLVAKQPINQTRAAEEQAEIASAQKVADAEAAILAKRTAAWDQFRQEVAKRNFQASREQVGAELTSTARAIVPAQANSNAALAAAQSQVYAAFLIAEAAASERAAQAEAHQAEVTNAVAAATNRARASQQAAYETKTAFIAKVNEEAAALFRTKDAQLALDAERAGVSAKEAAQLAKMSGDREFLSDIREKIAEQRKLSEEYGKTEAQILSMRAAERGLKNTAAGPIKRLETLTDSNKAAADTDRLTKSNDAFVESVNRQANAIGKLPSQLLAEEAALKGVTAQTQLAINKLAQYEAKTGQAGKASYNFNNNLQTLRYTFSDIIASAGSGISPMTILLQQGPQLAQVEGGISGIFKTGLRLITPFNVAVGAAAAVVGVLGYAMYKGAQQSKDFADAIVLSGNFAGQTEGKFNSLARSISDGSKSGLIAASDVREFGKALVATGEISPANFDVATEAAVRFGKATGKTAEDVAAQFASLSRDVSAGASKMNESLNFLTITQLQHIRSLQDQGKVTEAVGIVLDALNARLKKLEPNLGSLDRLVLKATKGWKEFWDGVYDVGRKETLDDKLVKAGDRLLAARQYEKNPTVVGFGGSFLAAAKAATEKASTEFQALSKLQNAADAAAKATGEDAELTKLASASVAYYRAAETSTKSQIGLQRELNEEKRNFAYLVKKAAQELDDTGKTTVELPTPELRAAKQAQIRESYKNAPGASEADAQRKSQLAKDLQSFTEELAKESDALKFHQSELQAIYAAGGISLQKFYDDKERTTAAGVQAELDAQNKTTERLNKELKTGKFKDDHERTDTEKQRNESIAKSANIVRDADHAAALAAYERAAAVKSLAKEVVNFQAGLLQQSGDEFGAAQIRTMQALSDAREFARKATPLQTTGDLARFDRAKEAGTDLDSLAQKQFALNEVTNTFAEVQKQVGQVTAASVAAEELLSITQQQRGASLVESERELFEVRSRTLDQLIRLRDVAIAAAEGSNDAAVLQRAADLSLQVAKAADAVEPAMNRMRSAGQSLADSVSQTIGSAITDFKGLPALVNSVFKDIQQSFIKIVVVDPLRKQLEGTFRDLFGTGQGAAASKATDIAKEQQAKAMAAANDPQKIAALETATALKSLADAANAATAALGGKPTSVSDPNIIARYAGTSNDPFAANFENESDKESSKKAAADLSEFGKTAVSATNDIIRLAESASSGGNALALLPRIIQLIQSASTLSSSSSSSGLDSILKMFGGGSSSGWASGSSGMITSGFDLGGMGFAAGGRPPVGVPSIVGEKGPEWFIPDSAGTIIANDGGAGKMASGFLPATVRGGAATGTNELERDMITLVHKGEAIVPKPYNPSLPASLAKAGGNVYITNTYATAKVSAQRDSSGDWRVLVEAAADEAHNRIAADHASGTGRSSQALKSRGVNLSGALARRA